MKKAIETQIVESQENVEVQNTETQLAQVVSQLALLDENAKLKDVIAKVNEIINVISSKSSTRNRGPSSTREMTDEDARRVMLGDLKDDSHKDAAEKLQLSYGQIYSARKGYTFKPIYKEMTNGNKAK